eukprot:2129875-Pyramimonas_sp.AAC.1
MAQDGQTTPRALQDGRGSRLNCLLLHLPHQGNSPGDCFGVGWWGYAKREESKILATTALLIMRTIAMTI